jgi:hypothetical protein
MLMITEKRYETLPLLFSSIGLDNLSVALDFKDLGLSVLWGAGASPWVGAPARVIAPDKCLVKYNRIYQFATAFSPFNIFVI